MLMIITLHFLDKGGILADTKAKSWSAGENLAWFLEALSIVAVNCYVLISGFFAGRKVFDPRKLIRLWGEILFYSIFIVALTILFFPALVTDFTFYDIIKIVCPVITEHYWFASSYIMLFLLSPFLDFGISRISPGHFRILLPVLLGVFSLSVSLLPMVAFPWNRRGYDVLWFVVIYLTGAYIARFYQTFLRRKLIWLLLYMTAVSGIFIQTQVLRSIHLATGKLGEIIDCGYNYNNILCLAGAIGLFGFFSSVKLKSSALKKVIRYFAGSSFGVYLIHEHMLLRYRWPAWFGAMPTEDFSWIPKWITAMFAVYGACTLLDKIRAFMISAFFERKHLYD